MAIALHLMYLIFYSRDTNISRYITLFHPRYDG